MTDAVGGRIVLLGASYAAGWNLDGIAGLTVINRGVGGQQSWEMLERFDRDVASEQPRAVIIWGHINDVFRASPEGVDAAVARTRSSVEQMIARARSARIEPVLATEVTIGGTGHWRETLSSLITWARGKQSYVDYINGHVTAVNDWLRQLAQRERLALLDLQPVLADSAGRRRLEFSKEDGSHITPRGYEALSQYARPILEQHFRSRPGASGN